MVTQKHMNKVTAILETFLLYFMTSIIYLNTAASSMCAKMGFTSGNSLMLDCFERWLDAEQAQAITWTNDD